MLELLTSLLTDHWWLLASYYLKFAILMYAVCYVIDEVIGLPLIGPIPSTLTHAELRKFIQAICDEIVNIPDTFDFSGIPGRQNESLPYFDPKKYEQLLATAVINKISDCFQNDKNPQYDLSSGIHSDAELDSNHNQVNGKAVDLMATSHQTASPTVERLNSKVADDESHLSDYVQNHFVPLPDLSTDSAAEDVDDHSVVSSNGTDATWEDNWLFKKRKLKTENQTIAMLVPSPTEEIKALIGDTNADETSDLSENSDVEDDEGHSIEPKSIFTNTLLIQSKSNQEHSREISTASMTINAPSPDSLTSMQSLTSMDTSSPVLTEAKNNMLFMTDDSAKPQAFQQAERINFVLNGSVSGTPLGELTVQIDRPMDDEEAFDSIVSPTQIREHKKSIDEQFEKLLMDDNNNNPEILLPDVVQQPAEVFMEIVEPKKIESKSLEVSALAVAAKDVSKPDSSDSEWEHVPNEDDAKQLKLLDELSMSIDTNTSLIGHPSSSSNMHKSDTFDSQTELAELERDAEPIVSPKHVRYSSPLFQLAPPIEPVKMSKSIPDDYSISSLLHVANLVSKAQKIPESPVDDPSKDQHVETLKIAPINNTNDLVPLNEPDDDVLLKKDLVPEKRPSIVDPEQVLMENLVPGSIADREHRKWLHAAPIAKNPYSAEALQRRLSETENKTKTLGISNNKMVDILIEESQAHEETPKDDEAEEVFKPQKVDMKRYKRDYYINDPSESIKRYSPSSTNTSKSNTSSFEIDDDQSDNIVPITSGEKSFRSRPIYSGDIDSTGGSITSDQDIPDHRNFVATPKSIKSADESLTFSEDSDTTRIYNLNTRETKLVLPLLETEINVKPESPIESPVKAQKFFRSSPIKVSDVRKMDDEVTTVVRTSNRSLSNGSGSENIVQETYEEKQVIEPEVIESLPSVRKLAEIYAKDPAPSEIALNKPKTFIAHAVSEDNNEAVRPSSDSFAPIYNNNYHPAVGHSITARSIPAQVRADLKKSYSCDDDSIIRHDQREGSPEIAPGAARNSIAFFENLQKK